MFTAIDQITKLNLYTNILISKEFLIDRWRRENRRYSFLSPESLLWFLSAGQPLKVRRLVTIYHHLTSFFSSIIYYYPDLGALHYDSLSGNYWLSEFLGQENKQSSITPVKRDHWHESCSFFIKIEDCFQFLKVIIINVCIMSWGVSFFVNWLH